MPRKNAKPPATADNYSTSQTNALVLNKTPGTRFKRLMANQWQLMVMSIPFLALIAVFNYAPLWGWTMAFQRYRPNIKSVFDQQWVGFENFKTLFLVDDFTRVIRNTVAMSLINLFLGTVGSIALALMLNEVRNIRFKRTIQTVSYLPHFLSWVVAAGIVADSLAADGIVNQLLQQFNLVKEPVLFLQKGRMFWGVIGFSSLWKSVGWGTIIYLSAMAGIDMEQYEAVEIDGANRYQKIWHITLPGIKSTIIILLIMNAGHIMNAGFEQQYLLQKGPTMAFAETIDIYTLKWGISQGNYSLATAAGIFKSTVNILILFMVNWFAKRVGEDSLM